MNFLRLRAQLCEASFFRSLDFFIFQKYDLYNISYQQGGVFVKKPEGRYAWTATVGEKGQIVIPKQARELFDIRPGDTLLLLADMKRGIAIPPKARFAALAEDVFSDGEDET